MIVKASGCIILSEDTKKILFQLRKPDRKNKNYWGVWGGTSLENETPIETLVRELTEELGELPEITKFYPLHKMVSNDELFEYDTFIATVPTEFVPTLNHESEGYAWVNYERYPLPLHSGVKFILQNPKLISKIRTVVSQL